MANPFDEFDNEANPFDEFDAQSPAAKPRSRNLAAVANDTVITAANAVVGVPGAVAEFVSPGNRFSQGVRDFQQMGRDSQSDAVKADRARLEQAMDSDSLAENVAGVGRFIKDAPLQATAEALGNFVGPGAAIKGAQGVAKAVGFGAKGVQRTGLGAGAAVGGAAAGGDAAGNAYQQVMAMPDDVIMRDARAAELAAKGVSMGTIRESLAQRAGRDASIIPALVGAAGGVIGAEKIFAGASKAAGGAIARGAKGAVVEGLQEAAEEGITQFEGNRGAASVDPNVDLMKGVGGAAAYGGALGGITGGAIGAITPPRDLAAEAEEQRKAAADALDSAGSVGDMIEAASAMATRPEGDVMESTAKIAEASKLQQTLDAIGGDDYMAADIARIERLQEAADRNAEAVAKLNEAGGAPAADPNNRKPLMGEAYAADLAVQESLQAFDGRPLAPPLSAELPATNTSDVGPRPTPQQRQSVTDTRRAREGMQPTEAVDERATEQPVQWVDLTPLTDETQARQQLAQLRERAPEFGVNPNDMVLAPHPEQPGAFAVRTASVREPAAKQGPSLPQGDTARQSLSEASPTAIEQGKTLARGEAPKPGRDGSTAEQYPEGLQALTLTQAKMRRDVLRAQAKAAGQEAPALGIVRHPSVKGVKAQPGAKREPAFVLVNRSKPAAAPAPAPAPAPMTTAEQGRLDTAAESGRILGGPRVAQMRAAADRMLRNIEERQGVASPEEAAFLEEAGYGKPYDRIDANLGAQQSTDAKLTSATGLDVTTTRNRVGDRRTPNEPDSEPLPRHPAIYGGEADTRERPPVVTGERVGGAKPFVPFPPSEGEIEERAKPPQPPEEPQGPPKPKPPAEPKPPKEPKQPDPKEPKEPEEDDDAPRTRVSDAAFTEAMRTVEGNTELHEAITARSLPRAAAALQKSKNPAVQRVGELIKNLVGQVTIKSWPTKAELRRLGINELRVGGFYMPFHDTVTINPGRVPGATDRRGSEWVVAHELVHGLLVRVVNDPTPEQAPYVKQLKELFAHAKQQMRGESWYGLSDVHEFLSEAFTNTQFQLRLSKIPYERGNVWSRFVKTLARMLGMNSNVLTEALTLGEKLARGKRKKANALQRGKVYAETMADDERNALEELSRLDALFAMPKSEATDMAGIVADNDAGLSVRSSKLMPNETLYTITMPSGKPARITVRDQGIGPRIYTARHNEDSHSYDWDMGGRPGRNAESVEELGDVWLDVSELQPGDNGAMVYNIAATFAHNTDRVFIGDPNGFTKYAMIRRAEHMLSSALKFGTTRHLGPHAYQVEGHPDAPSLGGIDWVYGDDLGNIRKLIDFNLSVQARVKDAGSVVFNPETGRYTDRDGKALSRDDIRNLRDQGVGAGALAGGNTVARTALLRALRDAANGVGSGAGGIADADSVRPTDAQGRAGSRDAGGAAASRGPWEQPDLFGEGGSGRSGDGRPVGLLERLVRIASEHAAATGGIFYSVEPKGPTAENYRALEGRKVRYTVKVEDTGDTATVTNDAARALRSYDDRLGTMRKLLNCLAA